MLDRVNDSRANLASKIVVLLLLLLLLLLLGVSSIFLFLKRVSHTGESQSEIYIYMVYFLVSVSIRVGRDFLDGCR